MTAPDAAGRDAAPTAPPNVVFIITDQQRADHVGFGGNPVLDTPNIDRIAAAGTVFDRAYVANPICMPNRSSILTGRMPSRHGVRFNGISLDWGANTFVRALREAGYRTALVGKSHLQNMGHMPGVGTALFGDRPPATSPRWPDGWDAWEDLERHRTGPVDVPADFYGFDHVDLVVDHADEAGGHYHQWLVAQGVDRAAMCGPDNALERYEGWPTQVYKTALPPELHPTSYVTMRAVEQLEAAAAGGAPFFLHVGYPDPHHPFTPPGEWYHRYDPADVGVPESFDDPHTDSMPHFQALLTRRGSPHPVFTPAMWAPTEEQLREATAREYGSIAFIDHGVGQILGALDRLGLAENTVVVFTTDHGDMFGDHGMILKAVTHYDAVIRTPLAIATPAGTATGTEGRRTDGRRTDALVSSLDLSATLLDLCLGSPAAYHGMEGRSLVPLLDGSGTEGRDDVLVEEDEMIDVLGSGRPLRMRTLVTGSARLTLYDGMAHAELFDRTEDPNELRNLWADPAGRALRAEMTERLAQALLRADDEPVPTHFA